MAAHASPHDEGPFHVNTALVVATNACWFGGALSVALPGADGVQIVIVRVAEFKNALASLYATTRQ